MKNFVQSIMVVCGLVFSFNSFAGECGYFLPGTSDPPWVACGYLFKAHGNSGRTIAGSGYTVTICRGSYCTSANTDASGWWINPQKPCSTSAGQNDRCNVTVFATCNSNNCEGYGNQTVPIYKPALYNNFASRFDLSMPPNPLEPTPINPLDGQKNVATSFTARWDDGLDANRIFPTWIVRYDGYFKYWDWASTEPAMYQFIPANLPCTNPINGLCSTPFSGMPEGNYKWYVVAKMDVSADGYPPNTILRTASRASSFQIGRPPVREYQGCYTDNVDRALPNVLMTSGATVESCIQAAYDAGYRYAGLQWYGWCFGGNNLAYEKDTENQCNTLCDADMSQTCGGAWHNSVWSTGR